MEDSQDEAGLGEFLTFAGDDAVVDEYLSRGDLGISILVKPAKSNAPGRFDLVTRYKLPKEMISEYGVNGALLVLLDTIKATLDAKEEE